MQNIVFDHLLLGGGQIHLNHLAGELVPVLLPLFFFLEEFLVFFWDQIQDLPSMYCLQSSALFKVSLESLMSLVCLKRWPALAFSLFP